MPDNSNPYMVVGAPSYSAPLVNLFGDMASGAQLGASLGQGAKKFMNSWSQPQWPQPGQRAQGVPYADATMPGTQGPQPNPNVSPYTAPTGQDRINQGFGAVSQSPQYARNLAHVFGLDLGGTSPGAQSPTQWDGKAVPYTNFNFMNG